MSPLVRKYTVCQGIDVGFQKAPQTLVLHIFIRSTFDGKSERIENGTNKFIVPDLAGSPIRCRAQQRQKMLAEKENLRAHLNFLTNCSDFPQCFPHHKKDWSVKRPFVLNSQYFSVLELVLLWTVQLWTVLLSTVRLRTVCSVTVQVVCSRHSLHCFKGVAPGSQERGGSLRLMGRVPLGPTLFLAMTSCASICT